jgi:hypothetical protein
MPHLELEHAAILGLDLVHLLLGSLVLSSVLAGGFHQSFTILTHGIPPLDVFVGGLVKVLLCSHKANTHHTHQQRV